MEKVDVVVVGAGLAGLAAAIVLADEGIQVLVVERGEYPGSKNVSGGRLYLEPVRPFLPEELWQDAPFERRVVKERVTLCSERGSVTATVCSDRFSEADHSVTILRSTFDQWLAEQATARGALVVPGYKVDGLLRDGDKVVGVRSGEADIGSDVVVLAEGILGFLAAEAGLRDRLSPRDFAVGVKEIIELPAERLEERFGVAEGSGVAQLFLGDITDGMVGGGFLYTNRESLSLGLVVGSEDLALRARTGEATEGEIPGPHELMEAFKSRPEIAPLIRGGHSVEYSAHGVLEGGGRSIKRLHADGVLAVGDAAGLAQNLGITVRGMDFALASGAIAGRAVALARQAGDFSSASLARYDELLSESFVLKDIATFKHLPRLLETPRVFQLYPDLVCELATDLYTFDSEPKPRLIGSTLSLLRKRLPLGAVLRDVWAARKV